MDAMWLRVLWVLVAAVVGAAVCGVIGFYGYSLLYPPHGCGDIGCWDALAGAMGGTLVGAIAGPIATIWWMRRKPKLEA